MKIIISSDLYWPVINGVSMFSRNLAKGLATRGHEVLVIAPSQTGKKYKEVDGNYTIARVASVIFPFYQNIRICLNPYREIKTIIKEFQPDIIHTQTSIMIGQAIVRYSQKYNIPIVSTNHAMPENLMDNLKKLAPISRSINFMLKKYFINFHLKTDYFTMPTQSAIDIFDLSNNKLKVPIEAVSNGIDLSRFSASEPSKEVMKKFKIPKNKPVITYVGRVDAEKHISVLISAFNRIVLKHDAHLLIVGCGTEIDNLIKQVDGLGLSDKVTFTGRVGDQEIVELHKVGTVFCMPSPAELQSIAMLEAMASGQPVVAVDAGPLKELCQNERNGYLCEPDNDKEIANGLVKIITNSKLRESMSKESLAIAKTHDLEKTLERFEEIYKSLINA